MLRGVRVKVEEDDDVVELDNREVHFTAFEGETSILETGYQLLNSLEAEEKYVIISYKIIPFNICYVPVVFFLLISQFV
ncbi:hypothetical protein NQ314_006006 [Rhamnusium bicolor]|uniref:Uncharacterized protein n=1 Tax=Rhamnusium bicolor TaxID=1586634 RepID=A0AAV8ZAA2_9CUCU|nr:hypothetical protein NQ314_006006 [Rhamnusium bicolor]